MAMDNQGQNQADLGNRLDDLAAFRAGLTDAPVSASPHHCWLIIATIISLFFIFGSWAIYLYSYYRNPDFLSLNTVVGSKQIPVITTTTESYIGARRTLIEGLNPSQPYLGTAQPRVTIVEFGDFACPYCRQSFTAVRELGLKYQTQVKIIWRNYPGHEFSLPLAEAAMCANEQGKFWPLHDQFFLNQSATLGKDKNDLALIASQVNVYNDQWKNCYDSEKYLTVLQKDASDAQLLGVSGTPTWFINGVKVEGALNITELENFIKPYLK